jgi:conjugative transfer signal peptidase TraF
LATRSITLTTIVAATALTLFTIIWRPAPRLLWNASASVPIGLYNVRPTTRLIVSELVVAMPPAPLAKLLAEGGYLPRNVPLIKRIAALPGQTVCRDNFVITVQGIDRGAARKRDHRGRPLPVWQGCRVIAEGDVFLMNWDEPASFDGRDFGSIPTSSILGRAEPLWTFEER